MTACTLHVILQGLQPQQLVWLPSGPFLTLSKPLAASFAPSSSSMPSTDVIGLSPIGSLTKSWNVLVLIAMAWITWRREEVKEKGEITWSKWQSQEYNTLLRSLSEPIVLQVSNTKFSKKARALGTVYSANTKLQKSIRHCRPPSRCRRSQEPLSQ